MRYRAQPVPRPRAIDPFSGFEVPNDTLVKDRSGDLVYRGFADPPHPQDFIRGRPERISLPNPRPEPPEQFMAVAIMQEDSGLPILLENGQPLLSEGKVVSL